MGWPNFSAFPSSCERNLWPGDAGRRSKGARPRFSQWAVAPVAPAPAPCDHPGRELVVSLCKGISVAERSRRRPATTRGCVVLKPMTPEEIQKAEFTVAVRGYSREEVEEFLSSLAQDQRTLIEELESAKREAEQTYLALGDEIGSLLQHAKDVADGMVKKAEEEAARVRDEARRSAERSKKEADEVAGRIVQTAKQEADGCIAEAREKVSDFQEAEARSRERLQNLRKMFQAITDEIRQAESKPPITRQPQDKHSTFVPERPDAGEAKGEEDGGGKQKAAARSAAGSKAKNKEPETAELTTQK
jgi:DivIVA domain-containing protein